MTDLDDRIARLTDAQKDCLRLYHQRHDVKHIAQKMHISVSAVDQRLMAARRTLGVARSQEAARLLAEAEACSLPTGAQAELAAGGAVSALSAQPRSILPWPTRGRPINDFTTGQRLAVIIGLTTIFMAVTALYLIAIGIIDKAI